MTKADTPLLGEAPEFQALLRSIQITAATDVTVLLLGETGTGKELLARSLHEQSRRHREPFVAINCAALPESLVESELFGHRKGAFTGASDHNQGRIRSADGGTLFLDEIAELPMAAQAKLLRFLESGECQAVGETRHHHADVRVIAATHVDLFERVGTGGFREDLFYRLNVVPLEIPSLRERHGDIPLLLEHLTADSAEQYGLEPPRYTPAALAALSGYRWPGNVRELRNFCERMVVLFSGREVDRDNLPHEIRAEQSSIGVAGLFTLPPGGIDWEELERGLLNQALERTGGNRSKAARLLGLTRDTLLYRIKKYALG